MLKDDLGEDVKFDHYLEEHPILDRLPRAGVILMFLFLLALCVYALLARFGWIEMPPH